MADRSQTSTGLSAYISGGLHKVLTLPAIVLSAKLILYCSFNNVDEEAPICKIWYALYSLSLMSCLS